MDRTALHEAIDFRKTSRLDVVRLLLETDYPADANARDDHGTLPIDVVALKALMREERLKYMSKAKDADPSAVEAVEQDLNELWECARFLALDPESFDRQIPTVHALLATTRTEVPMSLTEQVIRHSPLSQTDYEGNLPLHIVADSDRIQQTHDDGRGDEPGEGSLRLLRTMLHKHPQAAGVRNNAGELPIDLAIASGRRWETGISLLLDADPVAGMDRRFTHGTEAGSMPANVSVMVRATVTAGLAKLVDEVKKYAPAM